VGHIHRILAGGETEAAASTAAQRSASGFSEGEIRQDFVRRKAQLASQKL
jgi:hypothetical protein